MRIYILSDNKVIEHRPKDLMAEWGFAALVEFNHEFILFDTGKRVVNHNAQLMRAPLDKVNKIVISHGHYDHTTGLPEILRILDAELYLHPHAWLPRYVKEEYIGMPYKKEEIESLASIVEHEEPVEVVKNLWGLGEIPRKHEGGKLDSYMVMNGRKVHDEILDDQALAMKTQEGVVLLLGCCHAGLKNTVEYAEEVVGDEVRRIIGGMHFISLNDKEIEEGGKWLDNKIDFVAPCHCTGFKAEAILSSMLSDRFNAIGAGSVLTL
ncbi:MAG: MBL fold metallo-hydrolase [Archaeoglobaceae archaeon]